MQENEFEKQVKDKMGEFQLSPSGAAWEKVSRRINDDKKKKRYFIFLLFFGLIAAGGFGVFIAGKNMQQQRATTQIKHDALPKADSVVTANSNKNTSGKTLPAPAKPDETITIKSGLNDTTKSINEHAATVALSKSISSKNVFNQATKARKHQPINTTGNNSLAGDKNKVVGAAAESKAVQENMDTLNFSGVENTFGNKDAALSPAVNNTNIALPPVVHNYTIDSSITQLDSIKKMQFFADSATIIKQQKKHPVITHKIPAWQWGINAFYGRSNLKESIISHNKSSPTAYYGVSNTGGAAVDSLRSNNLYTSSYAYNIGAVVQKKILKNAVVGVGLNYQHLSVKSHISSLINSGFILQYNNNANNYLINNYYRPGGAAVYTNTYNFIELPVYFQQDILYAKKVSVAYNAGFSVRQLLNSNALIYNEANGIYYFKNGLLHKTQFQLQAGFNVKFNTGKSTSVYIGPQFSYGLSNNFKNNNDGTFHFVQYGLQAGLLLHKK